jgi:hypothetical protein
VITVLDRASSVGGGLAFAIFWIGGLLDMSVGDWGLSLALHALTIVLLTWTGFAILRTRTVGPYQVGGVGLAMIVIGLVASLELVMVGMFLLGSLAASGPTSTVRRVGAFLLMGGAVVFLTLLGGRHTRSVADGSRWIRHVSRRTRSWVDRPRPCPEASCACEAWSVHELRRKPRDTAEVTEDDHWGHGDRRTSPRHARLRDPGVRPALSEEQLAPRGFRQGDDPFDVLHVGSLVVSEPLRVVQHRPCDRLSGAGHRRAP